MPKDENGVKITNVDLWESLEGVKDQIKDLSEKLAILNVEFKPVKNIVFGMIGLIALSVFSYLISLAIRTVSIK